MKKILKKLYFSSLTFCGIPFLVREVFQKSRFSIVLFHNPNRDDFKRHVGFLKKKYTPISFKDLDNAILKKEKLPPKALLITLDDGHIGNYALLDIIREEGVPISIFLTSGIIDSGKEFWFKFVQIENIKERLKKLPNAIRLKELEKLGFNQHSESGTLNALTRAMILEMMEFVEFGSHTISHPCLPYCENDEAWEEISNSRIQLELMLDRDVTIFSYPNGDYSERDVQMIKRAGYKYAVTCDLGFNSVDSNPFLLKRQNCEDNASIYELNAKVTGLHFFIKKLIGM